jgi:uncharacterized membrane protein YGL010W
MSKLDAYFNDYGLYHQTKGNQRTHALGIPMIVVAVLSWASHWVWATSSFPELPGSLVQLDFAELILGLASAWYVFLDWKLGLPFLAVLYGAYWVGRAISPEFAAVLFVGGWVLQFVGHGVYEKKSPAFTKNIEHLLIGPIWVFVKFLHL